jgi:1-acyl-sn-glycerol-3-phosphate acyltransferase
MDRSARPEPWYHAIRWTVFPLLRVWFLWHFEGLERIPSSGPVLIACNHASYLDPLVNAYAVLRAGRRPRFLAKQELFRAPGIKWAMKGTRQIPVARGTRDRASLDAAQAALARGEVVLVYPEGTVTKREDGLPMPGKTGTARLALASGVPILPMASWGSTPVWQKSGPGSLRPGRPINVRIGEPIVAAGQANGTDDHEMLVELTTQVMESLTALAVDLRDRYPVAWSDR